MTQLIDEANNLYLADFQRFEKGAGAVHPVLKRLHQAGIARFAEQGFPGRHDEDWRFTSAAPLSRIPFERAIPDEENCSHVHHAPLPAGVILMTLDEALRSHGELVTAHLGRHADYKTHAFAALNAAFLDDGIFLYVPRGVRIEQPITLTHPATWANRPEVHYRRILLVLEPGSEATVVSGFFGHEQLQYCTNAVTEVVLGELARLDYYTVQEESDAAYHLAALQVQQGRSSTFRSHAIHIGGRWVRDEIGVVLAGEGSECTLNGLYLGQREQLLGNFTRIEHAVAHCASHELYKGILDGKAHGVFNGKIHVRQDAQKTDAKQTNQTLLLSEAATINTKPQLEIYADDVKCTHGATVGQLSKDALFYLRSRGLAEAEARNLLTYAFANDILDRIAVEAVRERLEQMLLEARHLPSADRMEDDA
jgi:Fe-S cluster assembly protein SufD